MSITQRALESLTKASHELEWPDLLGDCLDREEWEECRDELDACRRRVLQAIQKLIADPDARKDRKP